MQVFLLAALLAVSWINAAGYETGMIWDMGGQGRVDATNERISMDGNRAVVDVDDENSFCPRGIGGPGPNRKKITEVVFRYSAFRAQDSWLHIAWLTGESGKEQFEVLFNGKLIGKSNQVDAVTTLGRRTWERFSLRQQEGVNEIVLRGISGNGLLFDCLVLATTPDRPVPIRPFPKTPTLKSYEKEIGEEAVVLDDRHVRIYAPKRYEKEAGIILGYLAKAYDELYQIVGLHTEYKIIVYHFPKDHPYRIGGTARCTIRYSYDNLRFDESPEWRKHKVPHVSGYMEEMGHNFVSSSLALFGWEMVGWSICQEAFAGVAENPFHTAQLWNTRRIQKKTYDRYVANDFTVPEDVPRNLSDRVHAHILWTFREKYGEDFWPRFFSEIRSRREELLKARLVTPPSEAKAARYRITIDCFDSITDGQFKKMLTKSGISLSREITAKQSRVGWNRKFE